MSSVSTPGTPVRRFDPPAALEQLQGRGLLFGLVGLAVAAGGFFVDRGAFFQSWLIAFVFWTMIPLGCLALSMIHHLSRGAWGVVMRRILEAGARLLPLNFLFFLPLLAGMGELYSWSDPAAAEHDPVLAGKLIYLNVNGFVGRAVVFFALWSLIAWRLSKLSLMQDETGDASLFQRMQKWSAPGLLVIALTATFAAIDWTMSIDPHWISSLHGILFLASMALSGMAFAIPVVVWLAQREPMDEVVRKIHLHDYGKLLFAFVMLWAYMAVSQLIIIWSGNLPEDITWYLPRMRGYWTPLSAIVLVAHFVLPFLVLLSRDIKRHGNRLARIALFLLAMRAVETFWQVVPTLSPDGFSWGLIWIYLAALVGMGGVWVSFYFRTLRSRPILPLRDPYLEEALSHEHA